MSRKCSKFTLAFVTYEDTTSQLLSRLAFRMLTSNLGTGDLYIKGLFGYKYASADLEGGCRKPGSLICWGGISFVPAYTLYRPSHPNHHTWKCKSSRNPCIPTLIPGIARTVLRSKGKNIRQIATLFHPHPLRPTSSRLTEVNLNLVCLAFCLQQSQFVRGGGGVHRMWWVLFLQVWLLTLPWASCCSRALCQVLYC
jgi:hypothetical protein